MSHNSNHNINVSYSLDFDTRYSKHWNPSFLGVKESVQIDKHNNISFLFYLWDEIQRESINLSHTEGYNNTKNLLVPLDENDVEILVNLKVACNKK